MKTSMLLLVIMMIYVGPVGSVESLEDIYVLRSIREARPSEPSRCDASKTGFDPYQTDADRFFTFWSVETRKSDGKMIDAKSVQVAELQGCFGPTADRTRQNFYAEIRLGEISFRGRGGYTALALDVPEPGMYPVRCHLILSELPAPYLAGLLTTNTITSRAGIGGQSDPPGYTQASIATNRLWRKGP